ncbi:hypothetical protein HPB51_027262 [Rhipicephalus microplus]|uniref:RING-type domain-containing protein n=1 Tax=Rhipicephalus microplus TaxID=6941 RepID=A0A9J6D0P3_RHIMP|nr:hypothetical protein HPB51_027262 [Rhipicephalus microplus]
MEKQAMCSAVGESLMRSVQESKKELAVQAETTFKKEQVRAFAICAVEKFKKEDYKSNSAAGEIQEGPAKLEKKLSSDPSNALLSEVLAELPPLQQLAFRTALQSMKAKSSRGVRVQPIASFATKTQPPDHVLAKIVLDAIVQLRKHNAIVVAVISDGASTNKAMWSNFGISGKLHTANHKVQHPCEPNQASTSFAMYPTLSNALETIFFDTNMAWLGFTSHDPSTLQGTLPKYACPDLTNRPGNWAKALGERYAVADTLLHYYVNNAGEVFFGINGEEKGLFLNGVDVRGPLWALIDIYGNTTAIKMVEDEQLLNNRNEMIRNVALNTGGVEDLIRQMELVNSRETAAMAPVIADASSLDTLDGTPLQSPPHRRPTTMHAPSSATWQRLVFHSVLGPNCRLDPMDKPLWVISDKYACGKVKFFGQICCLNEIAASNMIGMDQLLSGSLAFGLTTCNPASLQHTASELPADLEALLDRPEYWVFQKDIPCLLNDELTFVTGDDGSKRGSPVTKIEQSTEQPIVEKSTAKAPKKPLEEPDDDCRICFEKPIDSVLVKCGHSLTCHECGLKLLKEAPQCPVCRQRIQEVIRIYKA